jgi:hypothetical protein
MNRITLTLGAAAGGMLASAFLSTATAFATGDPAPAPGDTLNFFGAPFETPGNPNGLPEIFANNGEPPYFGDVIGQQQFNVYDITAQGSSTTPVDVGEANYLYDQWTAGSITSTEYTQSAFVNTTSPAVAFTNLPDNGSVYDTINFGGGLENVYSDVLTGTGSSVTSTVTDGLYYNGTEILNLTPFVDMFALNPADFLVA